MRSSAISQMLSSAIIWISNNHLLLPPPFPHLISYSFQLLVFLSACFSLFISFPPPSLPPPLTPYSLQMCPIIFHPFPYGRATITFSPPHSNVSHLSLFLSSQVRPIINTRTSLMLSTYTPHLPDPSPPSLQLITPLTHTPVPITFPSAVPSSPRPHLRARHPPVSSPLYPHPRAHHPPLSRPIAPPRPHPRAHHLPLGRPITPSPTPQCPSLAPRPSHHPLSYTPGPISRPITPHSPTPRGPLPAPRPSHHTPSPTPLDPSPAPQLSHHPLTNPRHSQDASPQHESDPPQAYDPPAAVVVTERPSQDGPRSCHFCSYFF